MTADQAAQMIVNQERILLFLSDVFPSALVLAFAFFGAYLGRLAGGVVR